jgi:thiol-disulfide isomerase/thioredoxin
MVLCIIAMIIFGIMGIFSAKYRELAKESFECVFKTVQLKPCDSKLDQRIKSRLTAKLVNYSPWLAKQVYKYFEVLSWIFTIIFFASLAYSLYSIYNLIVLGTCEPGSFCIFNPGANLTGGNVCNITGRFIEFYGEGCPHCANMVPIVAQVENETGVKFDKLEVWYNKTNQGMFMNYSVYIDRDCNGVLGTPTFLSLKTNKSVCGEISADDLKNFIIQNG